jgi:sugar/nucleoside kinase (ribokinase family)
VARIGADLLGDAMLDELRSAGVLTQFIHRVPAAATGFTVVINAEEKPDKALLTFSGAMAGLRAQEVVVGFARARHLHVASYFLLPRLWAGLPKILQQARAQGMSTSIDPNPDPCERYDSGLHTALVETDYFLPNEVEAQRTTRSDTLQGALGSLPKMCRAAVVKAGAKGAWYVDARQTFHVEPKPVRVVDPTGAGDSFDVGFLGACLNGLPIPEALDAGAQAAALACSAAGGTTAFRNRRRTAAVARAIRPAPPGSRSLRR